MATNFTATTLSAAIDASQRTLTVASASGFTVGQYLLLEAEAVQILAISGTLITVMRGLSGTRAVPHGAGTNVLLSAPNNFETVGIFSNAGQDFQYSAGPNLFPTFPVTLTGASTLTPGQMLSGLVLMDPGAAVDLDLPTAADLVAAIPGCMLGTSFLLHVRNTANASETITVVAGTGGTISGTATIAQNNAKTFLIRITGEIPGGEAYVAYSLGTVVF